RAAPAVGEAGRADDARRRDGGHRVPGAGRGDRASGGGPAVRHPQASGAGGGPESRGGRRPRGHPALDPRSTRGDRAPRRAPHEPGHAGVRPRGGARLRTAHRRGPTRDDPARSRRHPRIPGERELMPALLEAEDLTAQYGWTKVLHGLAFAVESGGITTILGANGAGKTTTLRAVCRMVKTSGQVRFDGERIDAKATEEILRLGAYARREKSGLDQDYEKVYGYFPVLAQRRRQQAGTLSGGEQQMLAVARALMSRPRLLLLDEPSLGLAPLVVREIFRIVRTINQQERVSVLLVEQNAAMALDLADHAYLLETGRVVMSGPA